MPVKNNSRKLHHVAHKKEKRTKHFLKVYAPFIPLLLIIGCGIFISGHSELSADHGAVKGYATNTTPLGLLEETNNKRAEQGLKPLTVNQKLSSAAQTKAQDMANKNYWSHNTPEGDEPWKFIEASHYGYLKAAENLAYGFDSSGSTLNGWMNSPGHRANVLDDELAEVGFGIVNVADYQNHGPETIVVAMYGKPATLAATASQEPASTAPALQTPQSISFIQSLTAGKAPWSSFAVGIVIGSILMYLVVTHARGLRRAFVTSERFVLHHPLFDITLIAFSVLAVIANQTVGVIY